jgi:predicted membrane channel-forming protein YqfA (hemolysin III family)
MEEVILNSQSRLSIVSSQMFGQGITIMLVASQAFHIAHGIVSVLLKILDH